MSISVLLDPAKLPSRSMDQGAFDAAMAYLMQNIPALGAQMNATESSMAVLAAGGVYAIPFRVDLSTITNTDPTNGVLKFNASPLANSTALYIDTLSSAGADVTGLLDQFNRSSSPLKGRLKLTSLSNPEKWITFDVLAESTVSTWRQVSIANAWGIGTNPFLQNEIVILQFQPTGDAGIPGAYPTFRVQDQKPVGTSGGASVVGSQTRTLNTVLRNTLAGASLASNQVTLPAGTYKVTGSAPAYLSGGHQVYLYSVTGAATLLSGTVEYTNVSNAATGRSLVVGEITLAASTVLELRHSIATAASTGLGTQYTASYASAAVYAEIVFEKVG